MKKRFKNLLVAFMALAFVMTLIPTAVSAAWSLPPQAISSPDLRVGLVSDCHIRGSVNDVFTRALTPFKQMGGVDAIGIVGDLVYTASGVETLAQREALYDNALNGWNSVFTSNPPEMVYTMGNHEFTLNSSDATQSATAKQAFQNKIGDYDSVKTINGFTFITAAPKNYLGALSSDTENFIMTNAQAAIAQNPNKPVFLLIHHPPKDVYYGTMYTNVPAFYSTTFYNFLHTTPQIVFLCGHSHPPVQDPQNIYQYQGGYTCVDLPMSGLTKFRISGAVKYEKDELWHTDDSELWYGVSGTYLMEVKDNVVYIHKLDVINNRYIGDPYVIDVPKMAAGTGGYIYTDSYRSARATAPTYPSNATVDLSEPEQGKIQVLFSNNATKDTESAPGLCDNYVKGYKVTLYNASTGAQVATKNIYGDFFLTSQPSTKKTYFTGLDSGTTYRVGVAPISALEVVGNEVSSQITLSGAAETVSGYTFNGSTVTYDGASHMINVTAGANATQGVTVTYTCGGVAFSGATAVGTYPITATISKEGYNDLVLMATLRINSTSDPTQSDLLVDLDFSTYVKDKTTSTSSNPTSSIGSVTNNGTLKNSTTVVMASDDSSYANELDLAGFWNSQGEMTYYLDFSQAKTNCQTNNRKRFINEPALESQANTISLWFKYNPADNDPTAYIYKSIVDYSVNGTHLYTLRTDRTTSNNMILCDAYTGYNFKTTVNDANNQWANLVITNPTYSNGTKVMKTYINGTLLGETTATQPEGTVTTARFCIAGQNPYSNQTIVTPLHMQFAEVKVYPGELSQSEITALYNENSYKFVEGTAPSELEDIEGYTFSNSSVTYDGASHMINVTAGANATEGVTVTYTSNGAAFTGATAVGTYPVTATITKEGYNDLVLNATLTITEPALQNITGYTFSNSSVVYDGESHNITVTAAGGATQDVNITYTSNGAAFTGATAVGTYPVTATITKSGYNNLVLNATLTITSQQSAGGPLLELDFSNFEAVAYAPTETSIVPSSGPSGVTASGTWASGTTLGFSKRPSENRMTKESLHNANDGTTYYVDLYDEKTYPNVATGNSYNQHLMNMKLRNDAFESTANTISFWADIDNSNVWKEIFAYRVDYTSGSSAVESFDLGVNADGTWNAVSVPTSDKAISSTQAFCLPSGVTGAFEAPTGWKHIVITNPVRSNGQKTMDVYVNGSYVKSVTLDIPDNASINTVSCSFFSKANSTDGWWRTRDAVPPHGTLGDFKVYEGVLSSQEISALYAEQLPEFTEWSGQTVLSDIEGYTFSGSTVTYDGQSHNITVTAAQGATEGVDIAYTCGGTAFTGATDVGTYNVTATLTKSGYNDLVLNATLTIEEGQQDPGNDGEILVELDFTNLAPSTQSGSSGIVNSGTSQTAVLDMYSSNLVTLTADYLYDKDDQSTVKKVMRITHNVPGGIAAADAKQFKITDPAFEEQDITLSFWTNVDPISKQTAGNSFLAIAQYNAKRDDGTFKNDSDGTNSRGTLWQYNMDTQNPYHWGKAWAADFTVGRSKQWHHVVMTIPKFTDGVKTVDIYVDGVQKLTETVSLGGHALSESWIGLASSEVGRYIPGDISFGDVKVYAGAMSAEDIADLYDTEKTFYDNIAYNKLTVQSGGSDINKLTDLADNSTITINYEENATPGTRVFVASYDADGVLLSSNTAVAEGSGSISLTLPAGFNEVRIFTWNGESLMPIQKIKTLYK
ncbi:MAG: hypothetical protein J5590_04065 [Clostridia bacterium]|nr:hypothetical protein [Clostridia bacterium]